jgi:hypothetical protein
MFIVFVAYSTDRGNSWVHYGPLSIEEAARAYSAIDAKQNWSEPSDLIVHFAWHQAVDTGIPGQSSYRPSPCFYAKEVSYPNGLITAQFELPNSEEWDVWTPCIGVKDSFVVITAVNIGTNQMNYNCYIWRMDNGRVFLHGPFEGGPHFRFGNNGYMFFLWVWQDTPSHYLPYYCESFDYGETWTQPQIIWQDTQPYPNMSNVNCGWGQYDCEVVRDTPVVTVRLDSTGYSYNGDIWVYRPDSGGPGNWRFKGTRLFDCDSTIPRTFVVAYPTVAADDSGNTFIGYLATFILPRDTVIDCGLFARPSHQDTWYDWGRCTFGSNASYLEFAHNAPLITGGDSTIIGMIYTETYPNLNLYFDHLVLPNPPIPPPGIAEVKPIIQKRLKVAISPNPFRNSVKFTLPTFTDNATLSIFDVTGKLVRTLKSNNQKLTTDLIWDGRKADGARVNAGVYFYTISTRNSQYQGKIILTQ